MNKKTFEPENYSMVICSRCNGHGYIQNPERQCCPKCGVFGFVKKDMNTSPIIEKGKGGHDEGGRHL
jgi:DnaJ-class molecular chaperone